jgi:hypothetical protein
MRKTRWHGSVVRVLYLLALENRSTLTCLIRLLDMLGGGGGRWDDLENDLDKQDNDEDLMHDQLMEIDMGVRVICVC